MAINVPLNAQLQNATQLQQQIQNAVNAVRINLGGPNGARALSSLSQPLGRLTGQADEFTKSLDAANARVLAFGASVGVVNAVTNAFKSLVNSTIEVEKAITAISVVGDQFAGKTKELSQGLFSIAKATGQSFSEVSKAALEFSRQGLLLEDTLSRTQDALVLTRLTGLDAAKSVDGLTAAVNAFSKAGLSTTQIINKLAAVDQAFAVSSADLIEGFNRSAAVAQNAGVTFDELAGIITALQQETSRGGSVIGNALKTIFTRLQDTSTLNQLQNLGIAVQDLQGNILPARQILQNLAKDVEGLGQITKAGIFKDVAGTFQINQLISLVGDLNKENSVAAAATLKSASATNQAYIANEKLNQSLDAILNKVAATGKQLGSILGELGLTDNLKGLLDGINSFLEGANNLLQGDDLGSRFAKGFVKGIGSVLTGPGLGIFLAIIAKLSFDLLKFGTQSLKTFFGIGKAAADQKQIQESIVQTLLKNQSVLNSILTTQGGQSAQALKFLGILNQQAAAMQAIQSLAGGIAGTVYSAGYRQTGQGLQQRRSAGGYLPAQEAADVRRGVGGASPSSKVVSIPNFAFGGGKRGTMIANTSEYIVPNYAGGGSAIFNQDMVKTMGLPPGARKISAAGGFVPNFATVSDIAKLNPRIKSNLIKSEKTDQRLLQDDIVNLTNKRYNQIKVRSRAEGESENQYENNLLEEFKRGKYKKIYDYDPNSSLKFQGSSAVDGYKIRGNQIDLLEIKSGAWNSFEVLNKFLRALPENYGTGNKLDLWKKGRDSFSVNALLASPQTKLFRPTQRKLFKRSSEGYVPNFANYVFDSDKLPSGSRDAILNAILSSPKRKNLLTAPAGAGKSTYASNLGAFISSLDDVKKASSFTILSGASLSSKGGLSGRLTDILAAVNASGGTSSYLGVSNKDILARRSSRDITDTRSAQQLAGTAFAPLNQTSFIKQLKSSSSNFEMIREAKTNQDLAVLGLYGKNGAINGSPVYTLQSQRPELFKDIKKNLQKNVTNLVQGYAARIGKSVGIPVVPKNVEKSLNQLPSVAGFMFEDVLNQLAGPDFDSNRISGGSRADFPLNGNLRKVFGATGSQKYAEVKLNPYTTDAVSSILSKQKALAGGALGPQSIAGDKINEFKARAIALGIGQAGRVDTKTQSQRNALIKELIGAGIIKSGYGTSADQNKAIKRALGMASGGYVPNFAAAALQQAIAREKRAGLSDSQIYVDQSAALKSAMNPMGLMVANRRDEPAGGFQGIARARKEGVNPKLYGAANGFVPNYAVQAPIGQIAAIKGVLAQDKVDAFNKALADTAKQLKSNQISLSQAEQNIEIYAQTVGTSAKGQKILESEGKKLIQAYDTESKTRKQKAEELRKQRSDKKNISNAPQATAAKDLRDTIGALVGLQIASSAITGALTEAGENVQKFGTALSSALLNIQSIKELNKTESGIGFGNLKTGSAQARREIGAGFLRFGAANRAGSFGGLLKGVGLVSKGLLRFAPLIGQVVLGFDIVNNVLKAFGVDIVKSATDFFRGVNDAGQKAKDSISEFASALDESSNRISGENLFDILQKRANLLIQESKFKAAGIAQPKTEEELAKARETVLRQTSTAAFKELRGGQTIEQNIAKLGEKQVRGGGRGYSTVTRQTLSATVRKSAEEAYIEAFSGIERLSDESIKKLAKTQGIEGSDVKELRKKILKQVSEDLDQQLKTAKGTSSNDEDFVATFRQLANTKIFGKLISKLKATPQQAEAFAKRTQENIDGYLIAEKDFFDRKNRQFAEAINLFSAATSTKTFGSFGIGKQTEYLNKLDIGKSQQAFIQQLTDFAAQAKQELSSQYKTLGLEAGLTNEQQSQIESFIKNFDPSNIQAFNQELDNFVKLLGGVEKDNFNKLRQSANNLSNQQDEILSKRANELKLLQFTIQERNLETKAIEFYNKKIVSFGRGIFEAENGIQGLNSQLKILDLQKDFDIAISDAFASSSQDALLKRQGIESTNFQKQALIQTDIAEKQARLELQKNIFTKDNIIALNRNTTALKELLDIQSLVQERSLREEFDKLSLKKDYGAEEFTPAEESLYNQLSNVLKAISERRAISGTSFGPNNGSGEQKPLTYYAADELIAGYKKQLEQGKSAEDAIQSYVNTLKTNEEQSIIIRDALITYSRSVESESTKYKLLGEELSKAQELERNKNTLLSTYAATLQQQIKAGQDALLVPQSMGQFAAQQRKNALAQKTFDISRRGVTANEKTDPEEFKRQVGLNDADVREFMSSYYYGLSEGLAELDQKTLDFKAEFAKEIPNLFSSNLAQGLNDAISGAKDLKTALTDAATSFLRAITQKNIENLANLVTSGFGSFVPKANGGLITGGSGTKDDVPAMLMGGEYVMKKSAVNKYGKGFLDALNNGKMRGYATGGLVDPQTFPTQTGRGGFFTPGDYGQGAITGKNELLTFASQSFTGGQYDYMGGFGMGGAGVGLEPESARLSSFGRENSPMFERIQQSKDEAFKVYLEGLQREKEYAELLDQIAKDKKARKKQLQTAIISAVVSSVASYAGNTFSTGAKNATASSLASGGKGGLLTSAKGGLSNLGNIFSPSKALKLNTDAEFFKSIGVGSYKDLFSGQVSSEDYIKLFQKYPNLGKSYTFSGGAYRAAGGLISGGSNIRDDVPAMLTGGEFVLNNRATQRIGLQNLNKLNSGQSVGGEGASAEMTQALISKLDELIQATQNSSSENVVVNVSTSEADGQNQENPAGAEKELHKKIRQAVLDVIAQEKRLGGSLEKSR